MSSNPPKIRHDYIVDPIRFLDDGIPSFIAPGTDGADSDTQTVTSFGEEWQRFNTFSDEELNAIGDRYFSLVERRLSSDTLALDVGCGSGRWSRYLAPRIKRVEAVDPSEAVHVAHKMCRKLDNVRVSHAGFREIPFAPASFDLVFSLGVLHHIPDTAAAVKEVAKYVKPGGCMLIYLYYNLDNRGLLFQTIFNATNLVRAFISGLPQTWKNLICDVIATIVYWPLAKISLSLKKALPSSDIWTKLPLSFYHDRSFTIMRNDSLDRFGTPLEQRFSRDQCHQMMREAGLVDIEFMEREPYWCVVGTRPMTT